jgi:hypothetical protein
VARCHDDECATIIEWLLMASGRKMPVDFPQLDPLDKRWPVQTTGLIARPKGTDAAYTLGKDAAINTETHEYWIPHWSTCKGAKRWRR